MNRFAETTLPWLRAFGIDLPKPVAAFRALLAVVRDYRLFRRALGKEQGTRWALHFALPCLQERRAVSGTGRGHYNHQDLWVHTVFSHGSRNDTLMSVLRSVD